MWPSGLFSRARRVLEGAHDENAVPAILDQMYRLETEDHTVYATYDNPISPVDREQTERDFVLACSMIETFAPALFALKPSP